ncbi:probable E3 ubiquitin-protein ligase XERICO [Mangifera indica]|uniref:probable E3 ubiquitin-protein ligase XERICO n=1 Tax=Mangifera indica TaxID=29780 RepID=UPI001CFA04FC|nr:probable E3 ubiquitin-protein ligase XERICO [Mangifera indica]
MTNYLYAIRPFTNTTLNNTTTLDNAFRIRLMFSRVSTLQNWPQTERLHTSRRVYICHRHQLISDQQGPIIMSRILTPTTGLSPQDIKAITRRLMSLAREMDSNPINREARVLTIGLALVTATTRYSDDHRIREQSFLGSIPASKEVIQMLEKVAVEECIESMRECTICFEEFQFDVENVRLPCGHVYHQNCIAKWLEISHMCPLCRYQMPCSEN